MFFLLQKRFILDKNEVEDGFVVRVPKAYPLYEHGYKDNFRMARDYLAMHAPGLQLTGRNGLHRYNNQDHSVMTGFLAAQNIIEGTRQYDPMRVNEDADYLEEVR